MFAPNSSHFTGKKGGSTKRKKKVKVVRVHKNKYEKGSKNRR